MEGEQRRRHLVGIQGVDEAVRVPLRAVCVTPDLHVPAALRDQLDGGPAPSDVDMGVHQHVQGEGGHPSLHGHARRLVRVVHLVVHAVQVDQEIDVAKEPLGAGQLPLGREVVRLEGLGAQKAARIVDRALLLVAHVEAQPGGVAGPVAELSPGLPGVEVGRNHVARSCLVVRPGAPHAVAPVGHALATAEQGSRILLSLQIGVVPGRQSTAKPSRDLGRYGPGLDADCSHVPGPPGEGVGTLHDFYVLDRARIQVGQRGVHAGRAGREEARAVHVSAHLGFAERPDRRVESDGSAPHRVHAGDRPQRIAHVPWIGLANRIRLDLGRVSQVGAENVDLNTQHLHRTNLQLDVQRSHAARGYLHLLGRVPVAQRVDLHLIGAGRHAGNDEAPVGRRSSLQVLTRHTNRGPDYGRAVLARHLPGDLPGLLGGKISASKERDGDYQSFERSACARPVNSKLLSMMHCLYPHVTVTTAGYAPSCSLAPVGADGIDPSRGSALVENSSTRRRSRANLSTMDRQLGVAAFASLVSPARHTA